MWPKLGSRTSFHRAQLQMTFPQDSSTEECKWRLELSSQWLSKSHLLGTTSKKWKLRRLLCSGKSQRHKRWDWKLRYRLVSEQDRRLGNRFQPSSTRRLRLDSQGDRPVAPQMSQQCNNSPLYSSLPQIQESHCLDSSDPQHKECNHRQTWH